MDLLNIFIEQCNQLKAKLIAWAKEVDSEVDTETQEMLDQEAKSEKRFQLNHQCSGETQKRNPASNSHEIIEHSSLDDKELHLTEMPKKVKNNRVQFYDCLLCASCEFQESMIRMHYAKCHGLDLGDATLPSDKLRIICNQIDLQFRVNVNLLCSNKSSCEDNFCIQNRKL